MPGSSPQDFLDAHNTARAAVGVGPLTWDHNLAAYAQQYANSQRSRNGALVHSNNGRYGENLASGTGFDLTGTRAVEMWVAERDHYDYNSNRGVGGRVVGHYTQVVWMNSLRVGCARARCNNGAWFVTCNYDPPGNYVGQRPY